MLCRVLTHSFLEQRALPLPLPGHGGAGSAAAAAACTSVAVDAAGTIAVATSDGSVWEVMLGADDGSSATVVKVADLGGERVAAVRLGAHRAVLATTMGNVAAYR